MSKIPSKVPTSARIKEGDGMYLSFLKQHGSNQRGETGRFNLVDGEKLLALEGVVRRLTAKQVETLESE